MKITKEEVAKRLYDIISDIPEIDGKFFITDINLEDQEVIIKAHYHVVEDDDYIGFQSY
jgi:hypothetical protein